MNTPRSLRRRLLMQGAAAAAMALPVFGPSAIAAPAREFRIGHQKGLLSLLKGRGTLEKRLAPLGVALKWTEFAAGPVQLEALNVGSIDFGDVGDAPPIFAQAAGAPLAYVAATAARPKTEGVLLPPGSAIRTVAELKGKKVALNKGSNVHYFLVKLLEKHGLRYGDVNVVFLPPADARAAFEKGSIDAWVIWDPFLAAAEKTLDARLLADATGVSPNRGFYFSSLPYADKNIDVLRITVEEIGKLDAWATANRDQLAAEYSQLLGIAKPILDLSTSRTDFETVPVTPEILAVQQQIADTFFDLKLIPKRIHIHSDAVRSPWAS